MASFKIYKALPLETYQQLVQSNPKPPNIESNYQNQVASLGETMPLSSPTSFLDPPPPTLDDDVLSVEEVVNMLPTRQQDKGRKIINVSEQTFMTLDETFMDFDDFS